VELAPVDVRFFTDVGDGRNPWFRGLTARLHDVVERVFEEEDEVAVRVAGLVDPADGRAGSHIKRIGRPFRDARGGNRGRWNPGEDVAVGQAGRKRDSNVDERLALLGGRVRLLGGRNADKAEPGEQGSGGEHGKQGSVATNPHSPAHRRLLNDPRAPVSSCRA
jgi:hypothetical protein